MRPRLSDALRFGFLARPWGLEGLVGDWTPWWVLLCYWRARTGVDGAYAVPEFLGSPVSGFGIVPHAPNPFFGFIKGICSPHSVYTKGFLRKDLRPG